MIGRGFGARRAGGLIALLLGASVQAAPARSVSTNPCIDASLMEVADPAQIAAISHYSKAERSTSIPLSVAARFPATSGTAEEIIAKSPDLVLADAFSAVAMAAILRRLNVPMLSLAPPDTIDQSRAQIRQIAAAAGHPHRGETLVARIDAAAAAARTPGPPIPALIWVGGGMVPGTGTLPDALLSASGFHNQSADYGLRQWDVLPLELLVANPPRVLLTQSTAAHTDRLLGHPVLKPLGRRIAQRPYPERLLNCGGPSIIAALNHLAAVRKSL